MTYVSCFKWHAIRGVSTGERSEAIRRAGSGGLAVTDPAKTRDQRSKGARSVLFAALGTQERDQARDRAVALDRMAERDVLVQLVVRAATIALAREVATRLEVHDDAMSGSLGDPDEPRELPQPDLRIPRDAEEHVRVIREEGPARLGGNGLLSRRSFGHVGSREARLARHVCSNNGAMHFTTGVTERNVRRNYCHFSLVFVVYTRLVIRMLPVHDPTSAVEETTLAVLADAAGSAVTSNDIQRELRDASARDEHALHRLRAAGEGLGLRIRSVRMTCEAVTRGAHRRSLPAATAAMVVVSAGRGRARVVSGHDSQVVDAGELARLAGASSPSEELEWLVADPETSLDAIGDASHSERSPLRRLLELVKLERDDVWLAVVYAVGVGLLSLATPLGVQFLVNTVAFGALVQPLLVLSTMVLAGLVFAATLRGLQSYVVEGLQQRVFVRVALDLAHRLPRVRREAMDGLHAPELVNRFFDVMTVQKAAASLLVDGISVALQTLVGMLLLAFYHPFLLAFDVVLLGAITVVVFVLGRGATPTALKESKAKYALAAWLQETARHAETFKFQHADELARARAEALTRDYVAARRKHFSIVFRQFVGVLTIEVAASVVLLAVGGWLVIARQLTLGQLVAAELIVTAVVAGFAKLGKHFESFYDLVAAVEKLGQMTDLPVERSDGIRLPSAERGLTLRSSTLGVHPGSGTPLAGIELELQANGAIGILGPSGSGKSALVDVLTGLRSAVAGRVDIDGVHLAELAPSPLRRDIAIVRHDSLFAGTVDDNVRLGREEVSRHDARVALERVGAWEAVAALPDGIDTSIGSHGAGLSGDLARRVAVARALVHRPRLIVLDGIVDGLEPGTCEAVRAAVLSPDRPWSVLMTTARPDLLAWCDDAYELDDGALVLVRKGGIGPTVEV